jgi:hypothetical protein
MGVAPLQLLGSEGVHCTQVVVIGSQKGVGSEQCRSLTHVPGPFGR